MALELRKYDSDIPDECWSAGIGGETLYLFAGRNEAGEVTIEVNHGYEEGSKPWRRERHLFEKNEPALQAAAEDAVARLEARKASGAGFRPCCPPRKTVAVLPGMRLCLASSWLSRKRRRAISGPPWPP